MLINIFEFRANVWRRCDLHMQKGYGVNGYIQLQVIDGRMRSYQLTCTGSHQNSEVKRVWARVVLGWVTSWEVLVLHPPTFFFIFHNSFLRIFSGLFVARVVYN